MNAGIGFGDSCFPKDTKVLEYIAEQNGYELKTVRAAIDINKSQKTKLFDKASNRLITFDGLKVAVLGLTFKPGTDDLRESPSLENVPKLLEKGADVFAYDPVGANNFSRVHPEGKHGKGRITYTSTSEETLRDANVCFIFTEWG